MTKRILSLMLALVVIAGACFTAVPKLSASASLYAGDVISITDKAGGSVYYSANVNGTHYSVSAMNASKTGDASTYYAWCASYGVSTPTPGRQYRLYDWSGEYDAGTAFIDGSEYSLLLVYPWEGVYMYFDTGLKQYISFNWAMSCIKAAEALAGTTELSFAWRMAVELAIRSEILDINAAVSNGAFFGSGIIQHFTEADCDTVAEFAERTKNIADYASKHFVTWTPYAEEIYPIEENRNFYRGDYFILYEAWMNKADCDVTVVKGNNLGVTATMDGTLLTVKIPISKLKADMTIDWEVELYLDEGLNYNLMYGKPLNGGTDVQNIMVYETSGVELQIKLEGHYRVFDETAPITVYKTNANGEAMENIGFTLYTVDDNSKITPLNKLAFQNTDSTGVVFWNDLSLGTYFLEESTPPANLVGTSWAIEKTVAGVSSTNASLEEVTMNDGSGKAHTGVVIELTPGTTDVTLNVINELNEVGTVRVEKLDVDGNFMPGFSFTLYPVNADGSLGTGITQLSNNSGNIFFEDLLYGEYFVVENYVGTGYIPYEPQNWYVISEQSEYTQIEGKLGWKITLGKTTAYIEAVNYVPTNTVTVYKTDTKGNPLQGIQFRLYGVNDEGTAFTSLKTGTTNVNGLIDYGEMTAGKYFLIEVMSGHGYTPRTPEEWVINGVTEKQYTTINGYNGWLLTIPPEAECMVYAVNGKQPTIALDKLDRDGNPLAGMKFSLYLWENNSLTFLETYTTDADGHIDFGVFSTGYYFITEESDAKWKPYNPDEWRVVCATSAEYRTIGNLDGWMLYVDVGDDAVIKAVNDYTTSFIISKKNDKNMPIEGVEFTLEVSYDNGATYTVLATKLTDENGKASFTELDRYLHYRIAETKAAAGYSLLEKPIYIGSTSEEVVTVIVCNSPVLTLPMTGGNGMWSLYFAGALLALGTILLLTSKAAQNKKIQKGN